ncbi:MAG: TRAM domain-containing protein [Clostridia bacterium]
MLGKMLRIVFGAIGVLTGYTVADTVLMNLLAPGEPGLKVIIYLSSCLFFGTLMFYLTGLLFNVFTRFFGKAELSVSNVTFYEVVIGTMGLVVGLIVANLAAIPFRGIPIVGNAISILLNIGLGIGGIYFAISRKDEINLDAFRKKKSGDGSKILDSCVLIDGRIIDIIKSGFLEGRIMVPNFIVKELQVMADSQDQTKRNKGRRGLEVLEAMVKELEFAEVVETEFDETGQETDVKLLKYSGKSKCRIITTDYNLNKVAAVMGISVLNLNELAQAVKKMAFPGEKFYLSISKEGKENGQGIGYLEDGAMVIVENGREHIGREKQVTVTSITQTSAGRLIFARIE